MSLKLLSTLTGGSATRRLTARDGGAWEALVAEEYARVYNLHLRLTGDREVAADLTQETFVSAYLSAHTFGGRSRPTTWLYGVALNCNRNWRRRAGEHEEPEELNEDLTDPEPTAEEIATLRARNDLVCRAVQRLPEVYRRTVALRYFAGLSTAEIADGEQVDEGTVRWRLHRAMGKLWVMLQATLAEENEDETGIQGRIRLAP
jgi:RNA polymerase sigma-70 factor (ECF subfamily)